MSTGAVAAEYSYDSFGARTTTGSEVQRYGFTGREHDSESGLIYFRARHYDPVAGLFIQLDPIEFGGGIFNQYSYVGNMPLYLKDPTGLAGQRNNYKQLSIKGAKLAATTANGVGQSLLTVVESVLTDLETLGYFDSNLSGQPASGPTCSTQGNNKKSQKTQRAYIVFSQAGAHKVGITGGKARADGVSIRALRSMVKVKKELATMIGGMTGDLIVVVIHEIAGVPNSRDRMLKFEENASDALKKLKQPMNCHQRP